jgi:N-acetyl-anhydromuramyl-L-alanine amidase AmpD
MVITERFLPGDHTEGRAGRRPQSVVIHITDGDSLEGAYSWWMRPEIDASSHYLVDFDGSVVQAVREQDTAWTNGWDFSAGIARYKPDLSNPFIAAWWRQRINPNLVTITIEIVGRPGREPNGAQWASLTALVRSICVRWLIPIDRQRIIGHYQIDSVTRSRCPGLTDQQWSDLIRAVAGPNSANQAMEAIYQANAASLGPKLFAGFLSRDYYTGAVLVCARGVVTPAGLLDQARIVDDWSTHNTEHSTLLVYG